MPEPRVQRRLAAILAADVVGYSRLMGVDEAGTLAALKSRRQEILSPLLRQFGGRLVKVMGDGVLIEFASAVDAVQCALDLQKAFKTANESQPAEKHIVLRIGINLGDVIVEGQDLYGDGVNIAARLEGLAQPGGIVISDTVQRQIAGKLLVRLEDLGTKTLKNIAQPIQVFKAAIDTEASVGQPLPKALSLPDKPSIAVLPFNNMSGDPEQEYFADGMVEDIITALARFHGLFVIARNSSFTYKGRAVDVKQVGRELGVRYVLEGSVRKAGNRIRITGQLIDAATGRHFWAERFEEGTEDIFALQDQITARVVGAIAPKLEQAEIERTKFKPTDNLDAYDYYLQGMAAFHQWKKEANRVALQKFNEAIHLDDHFAVAHAMLARSYAQQQSCGWITDRPLAIAETLKHGQRAAELGREDALALCSAGVSIAFVAGDLSTGGRLVDQALRLNPNLAWVWLAGCILNVCRGEPELAIEHANRAMRLSPNDTQIFVMQAAIAMSYLIARRFEDALAWAENATAEHVDHIPATTVIAASAAYLGQSSKAKEAIKRLSQLKPDLRLANLSEVFPLQHPDSRSVWMEGLRKAGLPE